MATTYVALDSQTTTTATSTVTFSSIPATYTDLVVSINIAGLSVAETPKMYFNGDTSSLYSTTFIDANGTSTISNRTTAQGSFYGIGALNSGNPTGVSSILVNINNYANTTTFKTMMSRNAGGALATGMTVGLYRSTSAVSSISFIVHGGNTYSTGSTFTLYGIASAAAGTPKATGGNIITTDGSYWYHAFTASGTFTPASTLSCDILQVAGGGSGGWPYSGGGGAGGISYLTAQSVAASAQTITVGAGAAGAYNTGNGVRGSGSQFASLTAAVGGGGGVADSTVQYSTAVNGGSGGGGADYSRNAAGNAGGSATSGQGFAGGTGSPNGASQTSGGGGGGAGAVGGNGTATVAGAGGAGTNTYSSWLSPTGQGVSGFIAGGGGGGTNGGSHGAGGTGGGGKGANNTSTGTFEAEAGTANTGGGSGGGAAGGAPSSPKNGGSGLVIVRYAV